MINKKMLKLSVFLLILIGIVVIFARKYNRDIVYGLVEAIKQDDKIKIEEYMSKPFNINSIYRAGTGANAESPLAIACDYDNFELAKRMVLEKGADVNYVPENYSPAVEDVFSVNNNRTKTFEEYIDIYNFFLENGADVKKYSPLTCFGYYFYLEDYVNCLGEDETIKLIDYLLDSGASYGDTGVILSAVEINNLKILKHLIEDRGIPIKYDGYQDGYSLLFAVDKKSYECAKYLVDIGFRDDITFDFAENGNMTALELAKDIGDKKMIKILENNK